MIVTGQRKRTTPMGQLVIRCPKCRKQGYHEIARVQRHFTLFWIPLFPLGKVTTAVCNNCGYKSYLSNQKADELLGAPGN